MLILTAKTPTQNPIYPLSTFTLYRHNDCGIKTVLYFLMSLKIQWLQWYNINCWYKLMLELELNYCLCLLSSQTCYYINTPFFTRSWKWGKRSLQLSLLPEYRTPTSKNASQHATNSAILTPNNIILCTYKAQV
jgi:hypothetical protein